MPGSREEDFYRTDGHTLHMNCCPGGNESYNFGRPFLGHHYYIHGLSDLCLGVEKKIFKDIQQFTLLTQNDLPFGWGVMKFTISCLLTLQMLHTKFG